MLFQCMYCPSIKSGAPFKANGLKRWICRECATKIVEKARISKRHVVEVRDKLRSIMTKKD